MIYIYHLMSFRIGPLQQNVMYDSIVPVRWMRCLRANGLNGGVAEFTV